ncbi:MAG: KR prefix domain-containing protein, partial [Gammaproteobacteria bacterium]
MLTALAELYVRGAEVDWREFYRGLGHRRLDLPSYPFQRQRFWLSASEDPEGGTAAHDEVAPTAITKLIEHGDVDALVRRVAQSGDVAPEHLDALNACVQALIRQHRNEASAHAIPDWFYRIHWDDKPRNGKAWPRPRDPGRWLILGDRGGLGGELLRLLEREGASCVMYPATELPRNGAGQAGAPWRVVLDWLDGETSDRPPTDFRGIVHLGGLNAPAPDTLTAASLAQGEDGICGATLQLLQDLARHDWNVAPKLWLVTHGAVSTDDLPLPENALADAVYPRIGQAPLWGMGRVIRLEHPDLWGGLVDLAPEREAREQANALLAELRDADGEDQVALREGRRWVPRLRPMDPGSWGQGMAGGAKMARI